MGRTPMSGGTAFRFLASEVAAMEKALEDAAGATPARSVVEGLADQFTNSSERANQRAVAWKQVWNWFQNRRHAQKAKIEKSKTVETPSAARVTPVAGLNPDVHRSNLIQGSTVRKVDVPMDFEAKSARDGAWYDVSAFIDKRNLDTDLPEVKVRFAGFGSEEDEWVNISTAVRQRSLPCETTECVAVLPGDLILCFQEGSEQALYYDADILDVQRRRHDVRGCRCRFWVRYRHDQTEEVVPLRKVCRRPETEQRLQLAREGLKLGGTPNIKAAAQAPPLTPATPAQPSSAFNATPNLYTGLSTTPYTPVQQTPGLQPIPMQSMMSSPDTRPSPTQQQAVPSSVAQAHSTTPIGTQSAALPSIESSMTRQLNISAPAQQTPAGAEPNVPGTEPTAIVKPEVASTEPAEPSDQAQPMDGVSFTPATGAGQGSHSAEVDLPSETNAATNTDLPAVDEATRVGEAPVDEAARVGEAPVGEAARAEEGPVDEAARVGEAPVDEAPRVGEVPVDEAARVGEVPVDEAPRVGEVPVDEAMRVEEAPVDEAARVGETPVDEAMRVEEAPVDEAARVGEAPVGEAARAGEGPVDEAARVGEGPVDEAPRVGEVPVDEAMRVEEAPVDEAARVGETPVDEAMRVEEAPVDEAARVGETPVDEAKRVEEALVAAAPESILPM